MTTHARSAFGSVAPPACTDTGTELCNELDDDCDGMIDEDFDLQTSPRDCGACGNACRAMNADVACVAAECVVTGCLEGFADLDPATEDCEYRCPVFPAATEQCNGIDDDCDGMIDESAELLPPPDGLCRTTASTPCAAARPVCATRGTVTNWFCDYGATVEFDPSVPNGIVLEESLCDGFDGDCDGVADDPFTTLGDECDDGGRGACRDQGVIACDPADPSGTTCDLSALPDPAMPACRPGVGCLPLASVGAQCESDRECASHNCSPYAKICRVAAGEPCVAANCDMCLTWAGGSACSRTCDDQSDCNSLICLGDAGGYYTCKLRCPNIRLCPGECRLTRDATDSYCNCAECRPPDYNNEPLGAACEMDPDCHTGNCAGGTCRGIALEGEPCGAFLECAAGFCCAGVCGATC
jgi:hypothetical protein